MRQSTTKESKDTILLDCSNHRINVVITSLLLLIKKELITTFCGVKATLFSSEVQ